MKRVLSIILIAAFSVLSFAQKGTIALQSNGAKEECTKDAFEGFSATFSYENIESALVNTEKGEFYTINIEGTFPTGNEGTPQLPASRKLIAVPQGATPVVVVKSYTETEYKLDDYGINRIYPQQPSVSKSADPSTIKFIYKDEAYALRGYVNRPIAEVSMMGTLRNMRIASLTVNPVIYDAASNTIKVRNNIVLDVMFEGADKAATQSLFEATYSIYFESIYKSVFNRSVYDDHPDLWQSPVRMIVIAPENYMTTLEPWLEWKIRKGFYLDVHTTAEAGSSYNSIKTFVHNLYNEGVANGDTPVFLVLVGDTPQIPGTNGSASREVTDLYYSSVDGDYFPEMFCSRMCCENTTTLASLVEKILVYEQATMPDRSYLGNALLIAGADGTWNPKVGQPAVNYAATYHFNTEHNYNEGGVHAYLNSYTNCYSWLSSGVAFANYTAHGSNTSWANPSFTVNNVASLTNADKYFLAIGNCCIAADFGYSGVCFAEAMIRANQKGAYTYIGSCPNTYWYEDYYWGVGATNVTNGTTPTPDNSSTGVYDGMNMIESYNTTNSILFLGNLAVCYAHDGNYSTHKSPIYYWQAYHVLGDGSIMPYFGLPTENNVSHTTNVPIGVSVYDVIAEPGSYVAISKDGVLHGVALVGETGSVSVHLDPVTSTGDVDIVVTCPNKYPYMASVPAAASEGPYISVDEVTIGDDGILSYGETAGLSITIKNDGQDPTTANTTLTISCDNPLITIANGSVSCPILEPDATAEMGGFTIIISEDITDGQPFIFNTIATCNGTSWESSFTLSAYKPILEYSNFLWQGSFAPCETIDITVAFANAGSYPVYDVGGTLSTTNSNVTINEPTQPFGTIAAGETVMAVYSVIIADSAPTNEPISFTVNASGDDGVITAAGDFYIANSCNVIFDLHDSYGDGWNGASLTVAFDDGASSQNLTISSGDETSYKIEINTGTTVVVSFVSGSWNDECSFDIYYENSGDIIYESSGTPQAGIQCDFVCSCGTASVVICPQTQIIPISQGWSNISSYLAVNDTITFEDVFENSGMQWIFDPTFSSGIVIIQNPYVNPSISLLVGVNSGTTPWVNRIGYTIYSNEANLSFTIEGLLLEDMQTNITAGSWGLIPVLSEYAVNMTDILDDISGLDDSDIIYISSLSNSFMYAAGMVVSSSLASLQPGLAYSVYSTKAFTIDYAAYGNKAVTANDSYMPATPWTTATVNPNYHVIFADTKTLQSMSDYIEIGDVVAAFNSNGLCVGQGYYNGEEGLCIKVYGDDAMTEEIDGMTAGEEISFKLYRPTTGKTLDIVFEWSSEKSMFGNAAYQAKAFSKIIGVKNITGVEDYNSLNVNIYPNPTTGEVNIAANANIKSISVYNSVGALVETMCTSSPQNAATIDLSRYSAGIYMLTITTEEGVSVIKKVVVAR